MNPQTDREIARILRIVMAIVLVFSVAYVLTNDDDDSDGNDVALENESPSPTAMPTAEASQPVQPTQPAPLEPTQVPTTPTTSAPATSAPAVAPTTAPAPPRTTAPAPAPTTTRPPAGSTGIQPAPTTAAPTGPPGKITILSDAPEGCEDELTACRYADAPAGSTVGGAPRGLAVEVVEEGMLRVSVIQPGGGANPPGVGFVVTVRNITDQGAGTFTNNARIRPGFPVNIRVRPDDRVRVAVQELNEAGLGPAAQLIQGPTAGATPSPTPAN